NYSGFPFATHSAVRGKAGKFLLAGIGILTLTVGLPLLVRRKSPEASSPVMASTFPTDELPLAVRREGKALPVSWRSELPAVHEAASAELYIMDGKHKSQLNLNRRSLDSGSAVYWPESPGSDVRFQLELVLPHRRVTRLISANPPVATPVVLNAEVV